MSSISEIDIQDWVKVDIVTAKLMLDRMDVDFDNHNEMILFSNMIKNIELIQNQAVKQIPRLFQNWE